MGLAVGGAVVAAREGVSKGGVKMNKNLMWIIGIVAVVLLAGGWIVGIYNNLVSIDQEVKQGWAQIENQLQRRYDLIPNLVETVKGYAKHEKETFENITKARSAWTGAQSTQGKVSAANQMESALARLMVVVENYPMLQAAPNFRALQDELAGTENRIAIERMRYNEKVQMYNTRAKSIPTVVFVRMFGFDPEKIFFKAAEPAKEAPAVKF